MNIISNYFDMIMSYRYIGFCIVFVLAGCSSYASADAMSYYKSNYKSTKCDEYIRSNYNAYKDILLEIPSYYSSNDIKGIVNVIDSEDFVFYIKSLSECSSAYKYIGDANYFRSAHAYSLLLTDIVSNPNREYKESSQRVGELVEDIIDDIDKILLSKKIIKRLDKQ